jgi:hypothetical protein
MNKQQQLEERINCVTARIVDHEREIRVAEEAAKELVRLRSELRALVSEYLAIADEPEQGCWLEVVRLIEREVTK